MKSYKQILHDRLDQMKTSASRLVFSKQEDDKYVFELDPATYEKLKSLADGQQTTVQAVLGFMVEQQLNRNSAELALHISEERKEQNPLLLLSGICGRTR